MARAKQTVTTKVRRRKVGGDSGYLACNMCNGTGRVKKGYNKKKK